MSISIAENIDNYSDILIDGEVWYTQHTRMTLLDIKTVVDFVVMCKRLPNCFYEDIVDIHATNYSSIGNLFNRFVAKKYENTIGCFKPPLSYLIWVYENLYRSSTENKQFNYVPKQLPLL